MPVLEAVSSLLLAGAPPAAVSDARFAVAVYCATMCDTPSVIELQDALDDSFAIRANLSRVAKSDQVVVSVSDAAGFGLPDAETLRWYGVGVSEADAAGLAGAKEVLVLEAAAPIAGAIDAQRRLNRAALAFAERKGGWLEDLETRETFGRDAWRTERVDALAGEPALWRLVRVESRSDGDWDRMVTYGLGKFGVHEIVAAPVHPAFGDDLAALMILMGAQAVEGRTLTDGYAVDLASVKNSRVKGWLEEHRWADGEAGLIAAGSGQARLTLATSAPRDVENPTAQVQILLSGRDEAAQVEALGELLDGVWGWGAADGVAPEGAAAAPPAPAITEVVAPGDALAAASAAAREALVTDVQTRWRAGLPEGSSLLVKGPFRGPRGALEWMWVEVFHWEGGMLQGVLLNNPQQIPDRHKGDLVVVAEEEAFDYLLRLPDGRREGGSTESLLN